MALYNPKADSITLDNRALIVAVRGRFKLKLALLERDYAWLSITLRMLGLVVLFALAVIVGTPLIYREVPYLKPS